MGSDDSNEMDSIWITIWKAIKWIFSKTDLLLSNCFCKTSDENGTNLKNSAGFC